MGLSIKLATPVVNTEGTTITLADITGTYNVTSNPGGYRPTSIDSSNVKEVRISLPGVSGDVVVYNNLTSPTAAQIIMGNPFILAETHFGLARFPDSVLKIGYQVIGTNGPAMTYTTGSQNVVGTNTAPVIALVKSIYEAGAVAVEISPGVFAYYQLDPTWVYVVGAYTFSISEQFPYTTGSYAAAPSAGAVAYANVQSEGRECLAVAIGNLAINLTSTNCTQSAEEMALMRRYLHSLVAQIKYDCGDFATADRINKALAAYCQTPDNCNCS